MQGWTKGAEMVEVYFLPRERERGVNVCVSMAALCCEKEHKYFEATCYNHKTIVLQSSFLTARYGFFSRFCLYSNETFSPSSSKSQSLKEILDFFQKGWMCECV